MADTPQHTGIMIAFTIPSKQAAALALSTIDVPNGGSVLAAAELHITLAYLGDSTDTKLTQEQIVTTIGAWARWQGQVTGQISGVGRFLTDAGSDTNALYASFDSPDIARVRQNLVNELMSAGVQVASDHGFTPHITLAYIPQDADTPTIALDPIALTFDTVTLAWGDTRTTFALWSNPYALYSDGTAATGVVRFSTPVEQSDEWIERTGLIFRAGDYPDKAFSMTVDELQAAATAFRPVPLDLEHMPTVLDGKLGELSHVFVKDDTELWGTARLPRWLDQALDAAERKVSCTWDRATKQLTKLALVRTPRVSDAALMAAFSAAQHTKDTTMTEPQTDLFAAALDALLTSANGAKATFAGATLSKDTKSKIKSAHDALTTIAPDMCAAPAKMSEPQMPPELAAKFAAQEARIAEMEKINRETQAAAFADAEVQAKRVLPAERDLYFSLFVQAMEDDQARGVAHFSDGTQRNRTDMLKAALAARQPHSLTRELVPGNSYIVMSGAPGTDGNKDEAAAQQSRLNSILDMTEVGRKARTGK